MSEDWLREQLSNLKINELRTQTLHEIKNELLNSGGSNLSSTFIHNADLFDCADGEDSLVFNIETLIIFLLFNFIY